ncbi:hypothetical protein [Candidatus Electronema sp. PJ]|uniref:hypothetical protein n=1 Tax=Candidatus Electronema sp. PJ TaxID=3401572 RepID=UPI003AA8E966
MARKEFCQLAEESGRAGKELYSARKESDRLPKEFCQAGKKFCRLAEESGRAGKEFGSAAKKSGRLPKKFCQAAKEFCRLAEESGRLQLLANRAEMVSTQLEYLPKLPRLPAASC